MALKAAQKQLSAAPPPATMHRLGELEGALNQAMDDYQLLLKELGRLRKALERKGEDVADREAEAQDLRAQLQAALQEAAQNRCAAESCPKRRPQNRHEGPAMIAQIHCRLVKGSCSCQCRSQPSCCRRTCAWSSPCSSVF